MSISVIIPAYNYARFLPRTLRSVLAQNVSVPVEIIVVDDGSTDDTASVTQTVISSSSSDKPITYIFQENQGLSAARNTGMAHATGDALLFLDADDLIIEHVLQSQWDSLYTHNAQISICLNYMVKAPEPDSPLRFIGYYPLHAVDLAVHLCHANPAPPHAYMVLRETAQAAGPFDTTLAACEDRDFWWRCFLTGARAVNNTRAWVIYRRHGAGLTNNRRSQAVHEALTHARVGRDLRARTDFLPLRRPDAFIAYAAGALRWATLTLPFDTALTIRLLNQAAFAVQDALRAGLEQALLNDDAACMDNTARTDNAFCTSNAARTDDERRLLHYYALCTLSFMQSLGTIPHTRLQLAQDTLMRIVPYADTPSGITAKIQELEGHVFVNPALAMTPARVDAAGNVCTDV